VLKFSNIKPEIIKRNGTEFNVSYYRHVLTLIPSICPLKAAVSSTGYHSFVFSTSHVQILARSAVILDEIVRDFSQSLHAETGIF
jgi:hypothetical protein